MYMVPFGNESHSEHVMWRVFFDRWRTFIVSENLGVGLGNKLIKRRWGVMRLPHEQVTHLSLIYLIVMFG